MLATADTDDNALGSTLYLVHGLRNKARGKEDWRLLDDPHHLWRVARSIKAGRPYH